MFSLVIQKGAGHGRMHRALKPKLQEPYGTPRQFSNGASPLLQREPKCWRRISLTAGSFPSTPLPYDDNSAGLPSIGNLANRTSTLAAGFGGRLFSGQVFSGSRFQSR